MNQNQPGRTLFAIGFYGAIAWAIGYGLIGVFGHSWLIAPILTFVTLALVSGTMVGEDESEALTAEQLE